MAGLCEGGNEPPGSLKANPEVHNWLFMKGPLPVICIVAAYLIFVLKVGPDFMAKRKPYNLQAILVVYNLFLALYSLFIVIKYFAVGGISYAVYDGLCKPKVVSEDFLRNVSTLPTKLKVILQITFVRDRVYLLLSAQNQYAIADITWWYFMGKVFELADTVFFVLRKKHQQVTFLHVYHHSALILVVWYIYKYIPCEQASVCLFVNSVVHIFMYGYYMLAALGPRIQKYLWWKKYITLLQLVQNFVEKFGGDGYIIFYEWRVYIFNVNIVRRHVSNS
ncbi:hypothetical protein ANN_00174 [Periplaneta americana]|uniref:Elongation of very long chain fatty acids protein n=1 Tax=Periplaneta americana TaxID=6978 RepID=A0ABQ8TQ14_PERAM|nr:hypothetical protein ANN_00174 [Periplaneta americana]